MSKKQAAKSLLALGALGVVFGDIGTSPLYALMALFGLSGHHLTVNQTNIYGVISLIVWAVVIVVCLKYIVTLMRENNEGEGGIMALTTLVKKAKINKRYSFLVILIGIVGVSLFYGDSAITPAISVLSSIEGLKVITPSLQAFVVPVTMIILALLFALQHFGTNIIGKLFGPVMLLWFVVIGVAGGFKIYAHPGVLRALNPWTAIHFFIGHPFLGFISMTIVVLAITGAEALYADMGHFGRGPIARAWFFVAFPALLLCYMGQGAVMLNNPAALASPFYALFPSGLLVPAVVLATFATLIASQSVISGAFSLTRQAVQLGFLPNMVVRHTSDEESGQVYVPLVNGLLFVAVLALVVAFGSSSALAGAYGVAISGALLADTLLFMIVVLATRRLSRWNVVLAALLFLPLDLLFTSSNLTKVVSGGWFPLAVAVLMVIIITTWIKGEGLVGAARRREEGLLADYVKEIHFRRSTLSRIPGDGIYIGHHSGFAPLALHASVEQLRELHSRTLVVSVDIANRPHIKLEDRGKYIPLGSIRDHIGYLELTYGYHDTPNIPRTLSELAKLSPDFTINPDKAHYFVSLTNILPSSGHQMAHWRRAIFLFMTRNRLSMSDHYHLPPERTIDMEAVLEL